MLFLFIHYNVLRAKNLQIVVKFWVPEIPTLTYFRLQLHPSLKFLLLPSSLTYSCWTNTWICLFKAWNSLLATLLHLPFVPSNTFATTTSAFLSFCFLQFFFLKFNIGNWPNAVSLYEDSQVNEQEFISFSKFACYMLFRKNLLV